ncbi:MAG: cyclic pyranopterin monophosphate synthase MoaC [Planctomycetes bacterium]|nr:cyclic pyranopterin monophosphate synthase MoaC [Planctomycetota bacterium]
MAKKRLTHIDSKHRAKMVNVSEKGITYRKAVASCTVTMKPGTFKLLKLNKLPKGDVLEVSRIAGINAAKLTHLLIPLCHPLSITGVSVELRFQPPKRVIITATAEAIDRTGVEMEALTAVAVAGLAVYDMCKAVDKAVVIGDIKLLFKSGGKSGIYESVLVR